MVKVIASAVSQSTVTTIRRRLSRSSCHPENIVGEKNELLNYSALSMGEATGSVVIYFVNPLNPLQSLTPQEGDSQT